MTALSVLVIICIVLDLSPITEILALALAIAVLA